VYAAPSHWLHVIFIFTLWLSQIWPRLMAVGHSLGSIFGSQALQ
jgi:hypothetical protein